jgi:hypothetical protein
VVEHEVDALLLENPLEGLGNVHVNAHAANVWQELDHRDFRAESAPHAAEFKPNHAAANHNLLLKRCAIAVQQPAPIRQCCQLLLVSTCCQLLLVSFYWSASVVSFYWSAPLVSFYSSAPLVTFYWSAPKAYLNTTVSLECLGKARAGVTNGWHCRLRSSDSSPQAVLPKMANILPHKKVGRPPRTYFCYPSWVRTYVEWNME